MLQILQIQCRSILILRFGTMSLNKLQKIFAICINFQPTDHFLLELHGHFILFFSKKVLLTCPKIFSLLLVFLISRNFLKISQNIFKICSFSVRRILNYIFLCLL